MNNVRCNPFIGDGDSSAYATFDKSRPYGPKVSIQKEKCVNHVTKRMGSNLRRLVKKYKGKFEDGKGIAGKRRLTDARIDAIQNFYGSSVRDKGDVPKMSVEE